MKVQALFVLVFVAMAGLAHASHLRGGPRRAYASGVVGVGLEGLPSEGMGMGEGLPNDFNLVPGPVSTPYQASLSSYSSSGKGHGEAGVKGTAGVRVGKTVDLGNGGKAQVYAQANATSYASGQYHVGHDSIEAGGKAGFDVSAGVGSKLSADHGKLSVQTHLKAGIKAGVGAQVGAHLTGKNGPGIAGSLNAGMKAYVSDKVEGKAKFAHNSTASLTSESSAFVIEQAFAKGFANKTGVSDHVGAMIGAGVSTSVKGSVYNPNFGGISGTAGVSAGEDGGEAGGSLTVHDCMIRLQADITADLDVGAFFGGSVSVDPCKILKALEKLIKSGAVKAGEDVARDAKVLATLVAHSAVAHAVEHAVHAAQHAATQAVHDVAHAATRAVHGVEHDASQAWHAVTHVHIAPIHIAPIHIAPIHFP